MESDKDVCSDSEKQTIGENSKESNISTMDGILLCPPTPEKKCVQLKNHQTIKDNNCLDTSDM